MFSFAMTSGLASVFDKFKILITLRRAQKFGDTGPQEGLRKASGRPQEGRPQQKFGDTGPQEGLRKTSGRPQEGGGIAQAWTTWSEGASAPNGTVKCRGHGVPEMVTPASRTTAVLLVF